MSQNVCRGPLHGLKTISLKFWDPLVVPGETKTPTHLKPEESKEEKGEKKAITPGN